MITDYSYGHDSESYDNDHQIGYEYDDFITVVMIIMTVIVLLMIVIII